MIKKKTKKKYILFLIVGLSALLITLSVGYFVKTNETKEHVSMTEDGWVDIELTYIGSAKVSKIGVDTTWSDTPKYTDGDLEFTYAWFNFLSDYDDYQIDDKWFGFYDADFDVESTLEYRKGIRYVYSYGRELTWLQYQSKKKSNFGRVLTRAGVDWEKELEDYTVYFYEFEYDSKKNGPLADMAVED